MASTPPSWPGLSLAPVLRGQDDSLREAVVVENDEDYLGLRLRTLITDCYQLTVYPGESYGELFDLEKDPHQVRNLWGSTKHRTLRESLEDWLNMPYTKNLPESFVPIL